MLLNVDRASVVLWPNWLRIYITVIAIADIYYLTGLLEVLVRQIIE